MATMSKTPSIEDYIFADKLGSGSYADVFKAFKRNENREVVAIKCVQKSELSKAALDNLICEIQILKTLNHKNIVQLKDFTWNDDYIYIIMEYCSGGALYQFIQRRKCLPEHICQRFLQQLALALKYLREKNISHFDLKPQNILLSSRKLQVLKIADFGLAQHMSESDTTSSMKGSPLYMAPEIVLDKKYDARADIWSVGVILYECLFGKAPYSSRSFDELLAKIKSDSPIIIPPTSRISPECRDFLSKCLERDISKRFDFEQFFHHSFIDIKHAASESSLCKATEHLQEGIKWNEQGKGKEAFNEYNEAVKYLLPVLHMEENSQKRTQLRKKIHQYIHRMELLKKSARGCEASNLPTVPQIMNDPTYSYLEYKGNLSELSQLARTTNDMAAALEIAETGELYHKEKKYANALENYEMALGRLIALVGNEPLGRRRDLLLEEINRWLGQAEQVKIMVNHVNSSKGSDNMKDHEADIEKTCCLQ